MTWTPTPRTINLIGLASLHLEAAVETARLMAPDSIAGAAFAGQIELAAATLPFVDASLGDEPDLPAGDVADHLRWALDTLDEIPPLEGPTDVQLCAWHIHELVRMVTKTGVA